MAGRPPDPALDRELAALPADRRWREWMRRIEAVLFAASGPVPREDLARIVGQAAPLDLLLADLADDLADRPYELVRSGAGWLLRTRPAYAAAIRAAGHAETQALALAEFDLAVLAAIALHQPITREGLRDLFGREVSRDLIGRLADRDLVTAGPRAPRRGAPSTFVTTEAFLTAFDLETLQDLADAEQLADAGLVRD